MKKFNFKRMLLLAVMLMTLTSVIAVSAFALNSLPSTVVGGNGKIEGLEEGTTYQISPVLIKDQTTTDAAAEVDPAVTVRDDSWTDITTTSGNSDLAGLYKIKTADSTAKYVYVNGKAADVQAIATTAAGVDITTGNMWQVGKWIGIGYNGGTRVAVSTSNGYVTSTYDSHKAQVAGAAYKDIWFIQNDITIVEIRDEGTGALTGNKLRQYPNPALLIRLTDENKIEADGLIDTNGDGYDDTKVTAGVTLELYAEAVGKYSMKYALTAKEIIPATMFKSFTYGLSRQGSIDVGATDTKLQVLVYSVDTNTFSTYEAIASNKTSTTRGGQSNPSSKHTITADELTLVGGTTKLSALGDGNYIMGYEIFPAVNVTASNLTILDETSYNKFFPFIYYNEYDVDFATEATPTGVTYDAATNKLSGLTSGKPYYITTYDAAGADYASGVAITPAADGTYVVPATYKGLTAVYVKGNEYKLDSAPFIFWTSSDEAGQFMNADQQAVYYGAEGETGFDLIVPGKFYGPKIPAMADFKIVNDTLLGYHLRGYTVGSKLGTNADDGYAIYAVSGNHEALIPEVGIYYGFTSTEAFPIEKFEGLDLTKKSASPCQGDSTPTYITYDNGVTTTKVIRGTNGNTFQGDLVLYYVDEYGSLGTYTIKGTVQDSVAYTNNVYVATENDKTQLKALRGNYVIGFALKPYATITMAAGQTSLFSNYTNSGGFVYTYILNQDNNTHGFDLALPELPGTIVGGNGKIEGLEDGITYQISPVTMKSVTMSNPLGYSFSGSQYAAEVAADAWTDITTASGNSGLAGLYKIKTDGNAEKLVYVSGIAADKTNIGKTYVNSSNGKVYMLNNYDGSNWALGKFSKGAIVDAEINDSVIQMSSIQHEFRVYTGTKQYTEFYFDNNGAKTKPGTYILTQETNGDTTGAARALYAEAAEHYSAKYAMTSKEVVPANVFKSMTYKLSHIGGVNMGSTKTKVRFYVYDGTGTLRVYDAYDDVLTSATIGAYTEHTITSADAKLVTTDADLDRSIVYGTSTLADLGADSYILGFEIHPTAYVDTTKTATSAWTVEETGKETFHVFFDGAKYIIDIPVATKPTFLFNEATKVVSGLDVSTTNEYYIVKLKDNGSGALVPDGDKAALPTDAEGKADLGALGYKAGDFGIGAYGDDYTLDSDYTVVSIAAPDAPTFTYDSVAKEISGLEADTTDKYYAVQLGINSTVTLIEAVDATKVNLATDAEGKADLSALAAGLWGVGLNETSSSAASNYTVVYVSGTYAQKQALGDINPADGKPVTKTANDWQVGVWTGSLGYNHGQTIGKSYRLSNTGTHFISIGGTKVGSGSVSDKLYQGTPTEKAASQNTITADVNGLSFKYAYMGEEIIPAADFNSFTYKVGVRQGNTHLGAEGSPANNNTKFVVYVANTDGTITKYSKLINEPSMRLHMANNNTFSNEIVVTAADLAISDVTEGYIVAVEVFPVQITDPTEIYAIPTYKSGTEFLNFSFNFEVLYNKYSFDVPKAEINSGITYDAFENAISGLTDTTKEYYLATYTLDGTNTDLNGDGTYYDLKLEGIVDGMWALTDDAPTGLVAVVAKGDDYTADSDPVIFYTPSKNAGHFNSVAGTQISGVNTKAAGYYGTVGKLTYEATAPIFTGTPAASGLGGIKPSIYSSVTELAYQLIERKYTNTGIKVNDGTAEYTLYEEGALNGNMEDVAFFYGFESDEVFYVQDFKGLNISGATFLQGAAAKGAIVCDPGEAGAILDATSGKYYRVLNGHVNEGASFKSMLTLYYLDLTDDTMKSVSMLTDAIHDTTASVNFIPTSTMASLNGYVLGFSLKPYQEIDKNGHETIFSHNLNFGGQCYWTIGEAAGNVAVDNRTNSLNVGEHVYEGDVPTDMGGLNGSFVASAANEAAYADKYFQAAPLEISADGLSLVAGAYGDVFQLNNTNINTGFQGLWMVRFCNAAGTAGGAPSNVIYFTGTNETRLQLGNLSADGKPAISSANTWQKGIWSGSINYIDNATLGTNYRLSNSGFQIPAMNTSTLGSGSVQDMLYQGDDVQKEAAQNTLMSQINALSHKYAYMDEEIIPAKDFLSFTYKVGKRQGHVAFAADGSTANTNTKLVVYVANPDKTITKYEKLVNEPSMKIFANNGLSDKIVVKAEDLMNGTQSLKESAGYVIGVEIFPIQITDPTEIYALTPAASGFYNGSLNVDVIYGDYTLRVIPETPKFNVENALPADAVAGENYAYATITGLIPSYRYEMLVDAAADTWVDLPYYSNGTYNPGSTGMELHKSEYSIKVPVNTDGTKTETYVIRVKDSDLTTASPSVEVTVYYLDGEDYEFASLENEEQIINFASDFVEVQADYTIDLIKKPWTQNIALNNLKLASPKALITFEGDGFKFVVRAEDINIDRTVHYYSFNVGLNGASRKDFYFDEMKALAGDKFVAEYMLDSLYELPFTKADLHIYIGEEHNGKTLELRSYYEEIGRLRKWADADVDDGWIVFNLFDQAYVIYDNN